MRGWLRQAAGGLPRAFWLLWTGTLINRVGAFVIIFLAIYLTDERGFTQGQAGLVIGLNSAGGAVGTMAGGMLTDRWGRRPTLLTAQFGAAALMLCLGFAHEYWQIAVAAFVLGIFADGVRPAFSAMMIDVVPERDRVRAYSLNYWAINLGFAIAAACAGLAAQADYLLLFLVDAGTTLITALISLVFLAETRPVRVAVTRATAGIGTVFRDRIFMGFVLLNLCAVMVMFQHLSTLPIAMSADGLSPATFGWVIAVNGVLIVCGQLFVPRLIGNRDRSRILAFATVVVGVGFGLVAFADTAWFFAMTVVIWTLGEMFQSPSSSTLVAGLSPTAMRGRYQGVSSLSWSVGGALAPIIGGSVQERLGDATLWFGCAGLAILVAVGQFLSGPAWERRITRLRLAEAASTAEPDRPGPGEDVERHGEGADTGDTASTAGTAHTAAGPSSGTQPAAGVSPAALTAAPE